MTIPSQSQDRWIQLQQPVTPANLPPAYLLLLAALDQGWQIVGPVVNAQPQWQGGHLNFVFTLAQNTHFANLQQLSIPDGAEVEAFIAEEGLTIVGENLIQ